MLKETVTYTDYNGKEQTEDLYFNLEKHELIDLAFDLPDDIIVADEETGEIKENHMVEKLGDKGIYKFIKDVIKKAYGVKSADGRRFIKSDELTLEFTQTPMYDSILTKLTSDNDAATKFINTVIPADAAKDLPNLKVKE